MLSSEEGSQVSFYVQSSILAWVRLYDSFEAVADLRQLSNCSFFLHVLGSVPNFRLSSHIDPCEHLQTLAARVTAIKNIGKSLIRYHQEYLCRDVSQLEVNYVEMCMGNKKECLKLITLVLSALDGHGTSRELLEGVLDRLTQEQGEVLRIMIENSAKLGQQCNSCSGLSWRNSEQRKVFAKMEVLEGKIQQLEVVNQNLQEFIRGQREAQQSIESENKKLKEEVNKLVQENDNLLETHEKAVNDLKLALMEQSASKKKAELLRTRLEEKIKKYETQLQKLGRQSQEGRRNREKLDQVGEINRELRKQNQQLRQIIAKIEKQKLEYKKMMKQQGDDMLSLKQHCFDLQVKIEQMSLMLSQKFRDEQNVSKTSYFGKRMQIQEGSDSNRYRAKDNLKWLITQDSYESPTKSNLRLPKQEPNNFQIRTITEKSMEDSSIFDDIKENKSIFMNNSDIQKQFTSKKFKIAHKNQSQGRQEPKNKATEHDQIQKTYNQEIKLLTCVIIDLRAQLEEARAANPIICNNSSLSVSRMNKFSQKVKEMFKQPWTGAQ